MSKEHGDHVIVTVDDGTMFSCTLAPLGLGQGRRLVLLDAHARQYVGPEASASCSAAEIQGLVAAWWRVQEQRGEVDDASAVARRSSRRPR